MRYVEVTHTYVVPIPEDEAGDPAIDSVVNSGVSMMEAHIQGMFNQPREIRSDWKLMPREYQEGEHRTQGKVPEIRGTIATDDMAAIEARYAIENDLDQGINFSRDVMGQSPKATHPWDQGLSIFPEDHPYRPIEDHFRRQRDEEGLRLLQAQSPKLKELPPGE